MLATFTRITLISGTSTHICAGYKGSEPACLGDGEGDAYRHFRNSDLTSE